MTASTAAHGFHYVFDPSLFFTVVIAAASALTAVFTGLYWYVTKNQLAAMRDTLGETRASIQLNRQALVLSYRAWLKVEIEGTVFKGNALNKDGVRIRIRNAGRTPASTAQGTVHAFLEPTEEGDDTRAVRFGPLAVGVDGDLSFPIDLTFLGQSPASFLAGPPQRVLHVLVSVQYDDGMGSQGRTSHGWFLRLLSSGGESWGLAPGAQQIE